MGERVGRLNSIFLVHFSIDLSQCLLNPLAGLGTQISLIAMKTETQGPENSKKPCQ